MFISERLRAAVFYTGGQAPVGESEVRVCAGAVWREAQGQPSAAGLLTELICWTVFNKKDLAEVVLLGWQALLVQLELSQPVGLLMLHRPNVLDQV